MCIDESWECFKAFLFNFTYLRCPVLSNYTYMHPCVHERNCCCTSPVNSYLVVQMLSHITHRLTICWTYLCGLFWINFFSLSFSLHFITFFSSFLFKYKTFDWKHSISHPSTCYTSVQTHKLWWHIQEVVVTRCSCNLPNAHFVCCLHCVNVRSVKKKKKKKRKWHFKCKWCKVVCKSMDWYINYFGNKQMAIFTVFFLLSLLPLLLIT